MTTWKLVLLSLAISAGAILLVPGVTPAYASTVDCSSLKRLNFDHRYKKGDKVWSSNGYTGSGHPYTCILAECYQKNTTDQSAWQSSGDCTSRPPGL